MKKRTLDLNTLLDVEATKGDRRIVKEMTYEKYLELFKNDLKGWKIQAYQKGMLNK